MIFGFFLQSKSLESLTVRPQIKGYGLGKSSALNFHHSCMIHFCKAKKRKETFKEIIDKTIKKKKVIKTISFSIEEKMKTSGAPSRKLKSPPPPKPEPELDEEDAEDESQCEEQKKDDKHDNRENKDTKASNVVASEENDRDDLFTDEDDIDENIKLVKPPPLIHSASFFMTNKDSKENDIFEPSKIF